MATIALLISITGLLLQYTSWRNSNARLKVRLSFTYLMYGGAIDHRTRLTVSVSNHGRGEIQITNIWVQPKGSDSSIVFLRHEAGSAPLPAYLQSHSELTWYLPLDEIIDQLCHHGNRAFRVVVGLPGDKKVRSRWQEAKVAKLKN